MSERKENASVNHQNHPHQEGQQNNTPSIHEADGQRRSDNHNQPMSNMMTNRKNKVRAERTDNAVKALCSRKKDSLRTK